MGLKSKVFAAGAAVTLLGGIAAMAGTAQASSTGCAFTNGCATLHGVDAAGHAVAMDVKYKNPKEIVIGYPDVPGDGATSFDDVLHYTSGPKKTTYQDTGLTVTDFRNTCNTAAGHIEPLTVTGSGTAASGTIADSGNLLSVSTAAANVNITGGSGTATLDWASTTTHAPGPDPIVIAENYGAGCVALFGADVTTVNPTGHATFTGFTLGTVSVGGHIHETNTGSSIDTFTDTVSGGTFTFTALPAGVSQSGGVLTADTSTAIPGTYTSVGVVYTEPGGVIDTASFTLVVSGIKSVNPGPNIPYYTFVYAANGVWSNQCVTDNGGSGALQMQTCTLGKNQYQDFYALSAGVPSLLGGSQYIQNRLAAVASPASSCLTDPSILNPATPQTDAVDQAIGGRQLRTDGSCSGAQDQWTWAS